MKLLTQKCPLTDRRSCKICGPWTGWIDLANPGRKPTTFEWSNWCAKQQVKHDALRQREFDKLELVPNAK